MAVKEVDGVLFSDLDHDTKRADVEKELRAGRGVTELCVLNNRRGPTAKRVLVHMWTKDGRHFSFYNRYLAAGETVATHLHTLKIQVVAFEIRWQVIGNGSPMWATTGKIHAAPGEYFPAFGIRWDENDVYVLIFPD